jgi:hypothetical protein
MRINDTFLAAALSGAGGLSWPSREAALHSAAMAPARHIAAPLLALLACNNPGATSTSFTTPGPTTVPAESTAADSSSTDSSSSSGSSSGSSSTDGDSAVASSGTSTDDVMRLDMGPPPDFDPEPPGCQGKIDILFVLSRTDVMWEAQEQLVAAFPKFIDTIQSQFSDFDVHIMVVDSESKWKVEVCDDQCPDPCDVAPTYPCDAEPTECDNTVGAGTVFNAGPYTDNVPCGLDTGRYITADTLDISGTFACLGRVGTYGYNEMGDGLVAAMSTKLNGPGGCNEGFIRDDALLVLMMIGPEDPTFGPGVSKGTWQSWRQAVVDAKHDNLSAIVAAGIVGGEGCGTSDKHRLCKTILSFPSNLLESFDSVVSYDIVFDGAAELAIDACSLYVPG